MAAVYVLMGALVFGGVAQVGSYAGTVSVEVREDSTKEALRTAYIKGMLLGYDSGYYSKDSRVLEFHRREQDFHLRMDLYIRVELDTTGDLPVIRMTGEDREYAGEEWQIMQDMKRIAAELEECCGVRRPVDEGETDR
ncbi:MAG: hypothetical protein V3W31_08985 [Thermodesulfobacteriota bacterium]